MSRAGFGEGEGVAGVLAAGPGSMVVSSTTIVIFIRPVGRRCISIRVSRPTRQFAGGLKNATPGSGIA